MIKKTKSNNKFSLHVSNVLQDAIEYKMSWLKIHIDDGDIMDQDLPKAKYRLKDYKKALKLIRKMTSSKKE